MPGILLAALVAIVAVAVLPVGCSFDCGNEIVARIASPDGAYEAVLFDRNCGATTGFSTQISVLPAGTRPEDGSNVFRADANHDPNMRLGDWHGPWAEISWLSPRHLLIRYVAGARLFARETEVGGIVVSYEPVPTPSPARP